MRQPYIVTFVILLGLGSAVRASADSIDVPYRAALAGSEIGTVLLGIDVAGSAYRLSLRGLLPEQGAVKGVRAQAHASGRLARSGPQPEIYTADLDRAGERKRVALAFADGALAMVAVLPPGPGGSGRTRPPESQSRGVMDPLSALVLPAAPGGLAPLSACGRTLRVFDGFARYNVALFPSRVELTAIAGQPMAALVCRAELRRNLRAPRMERWPSLLPQGQTALLSFVPVADGRLLVPARIETDSRFGKLVVEATDANAFAAALRTVAVR